MSIHGDNTHVVIAGASGLIGHELLHLLNAEPAIASIYALSRRSLEPTLVSANLNDKVHTIIDSELRVTNWDATLPNPNLGFICLGTTRKQAGSKQALEKIDYERVCHVAQTMQVLGVKRIAIVSSYGAAKHSMSHYLQCKGKMEQAIIKMGFEQVVFMRPGPLAGNRITPRSDEQALQFVLKWLQPFMFGRLANLIPIQATDVAQAMLFSLFEPQQHHIEFLPSVKIKQLLEKYR